MNESERRDEQGSIIVALMAILVATGLIGGGIYHVMIVLVAITAIRYWRGTRTTLALALLGLPAAHFLLWLGGGLYAVSAINWLCIGSLDRLNHDLTGRVSRGA